MFFKVYGTNFISAHEFGFVEGTLRSEQALLEVALSLSLKGEERGGREREKEEGEREGGGGREGGRGREGGKEAIILCYLNPVCHSHSCPAPPPPTEERPGIHCLRIHLIPQEFVKYQTLAVH